MAPKPSIKSPEHLKEMLEKVYSLFELSQGPTKYTKENVLKCMRNAGFPKGALYYQGMLTLQFVARIGHTRKVKLTYTEVSDQRAEDLYGYFYPRHKTSEVVITPRSREIITTVRSLRGFSNEELLAELKKRHLNLVPMADNDGFRIKVPYGATIKVESTTIVTEDGIRTEVVKRQTLQPRSKQTMLDK